MADQVIYIVVAGDDPTELWVQADDAGQAAEIAHGHYRWKHEGRYPANLTVRFGKRVKDLIVDSAVPSKFMRDLE